MLKWLLIILFVDDTRARVDLREMLALPLTLAGLCLSVALIAVLLLIAASSRHRKSSTGQLELLGALASVETTLGPVGAVLLAGELWPACSRTGLTVERGMRVRVVGAKGHLLEVEPAS